VSFILTKTDRKSGLGEELATTEAMKPSDESEIRLATIVAISDNVFGIETVSTIVFMV
jgi:hypothetical protein